MMPEAIFLPISVPSVDLNFSLYAWVCYYINLGAQATSPRA